MTGSINSRSARWSHVFAAGESPWLEGWKEFALRAIAGGLSFCLYLGFAGAIFVPCPAAAQHRDLVVAPALEERVQFWVQIFTKYGKDQVVFHDRNDPGIVYSTLDFSEVAPVRSGASYERYKGDATDAEVARIQASLLYLADGAEPRNAFERRVERLFRRYGDWRRQAEYRDAAGLKRVRSQTGIKERFRDGLQRSTRFLYAIEHIFRERGLPTEIARLPLVESSFDYNAYSSVGAAGIWQFMRGTARHYMRVDNIVDERRDPIISSRAAADYLARARSTLGTWPLAVTSYNHGVTGVLRASREVGTTDIAKIIERYDGTSFGFASKNFFVEFLAALEVSKNANAYFPGLQLESPHYFDEVLLGRPVAYRELVQMSGLNAEQFTEYNPALMPPVTRGRAGVPAGYRAKVAPGFGRRVAEAVKGSRVTWARAEIANKEVLIEKRSVKKSKAKPKAKSSAATKKKKG
jgi:membrane-bound lytic murein transglycosylase D